MEKISKLQLRIGVYKMYISDFFYRLRHLYDTDEYHRGFEDGYAVAKRNVINNLNVGFLRQWLQVSSSYVDFNTEKFVKGLIENLNYCLDNGIDESIFKIAEIKDQISLYKKYLFGKDENSIFLNSIDLIMDNNSWDKMSNNQIQSFINELTRFEDGVVDWEKLAIFSKQIERLKINILDDAEEEK